MSILRINNSLYRHEKSLQLVLELYVFLNKPVLDSVHVLCLGLHAPSAGINASLLFQGRIVFFSNFFFSFYIQYYFSCPLLKPYHRSQLRWPVIIFKRQLFPPSYCFANCEVLRYRSETDVGCLIALLSFTSLNHHFFFFVAHLYITARVSYHHKKILSSAKVEMGHSPSLEFPSMNRSHFSVHFICTVGTEYLV